MGPRGLNFRNNENRCINDKRTIKVFMRVVLDGGLGPTRLTVCSYICVVLEATYALRPLKGGVSAQKVFQWSKTEMRELLGGSELLPRVLGLSSWLDDILQICSHPSYIFIACDPHASN